MERAIFEIILEQKEEEQKAGRNVATSQHRPSRRPNVAHHDVPTSSIAMPQRHDVATSRRQRDFCLTIIKIKRDQIPRGIENCTDEGTESRAAANQISGEDSCFCIFFFPKRLVMFYRLIMCITKSSMF